MPQGNGNDWQELQNRVAELEQIALAAAPVLRNPKKSMAGAVGALMLPDLAAWAYGQFIPAIQEIVCSIPT